jgi:hypothetical protein
MATFPASGDNGPAKNSYTVIGFWRWVFELAISDLDAAGYASRRVFCKQKEISESVMRLDRPSTANFLFSDGNRLVLGDSLVLEGLEDKDVFVTTMSKYSSDKIPPSTLLPYDMHLSDEKKKAALVLPSTPAVLKQPLGCCGHGVFFVSTVDEVLSKVKGNYARAQAEKGFMELIVRTKKRIPEWVLQSEIKGLPILSNRKFHLRTYVLIREHPTEGPVSLMYIRNHEVRVASEAMAPTPVNGDDLARVRSQHITNGAGGSDTMRMLLDDIPEIRNLRGKLEGFVSELFGKDLKEEFASRVGRKTDHPLADPWVIERFVVCGLDVMVDEHHDFYVLEVNRNPGVPPLASISDQGRFKNHLVQFAKDLYGQLQLEVPQQQDGRWSCLVF